MTSNIKSLNNYVFRPIYKSARRYGLSKQASLYVSHIPGAFLESIPLWLLDWKVALGGFLVSEAILPILLYRDYQRQVIERTKYGGLERKLQP